jgi:hypothetical protein
VIPPTQAALGPAPCWSSCWVAGRSSRNTASWRGVQLARVEVTCPLELLLMPLLGVDEDEGMLSGCSRARF